MFLEIFIEGQYIIKRKHRIRIPVIQSFPILVTSPRGRNRIEKSSINSITAINCESRFELQLRKHSNQYITGCQQTVFLVLVVFRTCHILQWVRNITYSIKVGIVLLRVQRIPDRSKSRRINNGQYDSSTIGTGSHCTAPVTGIIRVRDIGAYRQPVTNLIFKVHTEVIAFVVRNIQYSLFIQVSGGQIIFNLVIAVGYGYLIILCFSGRIRLVKPVCTVDQSIGQRN